MRTKVLMTVLALAFSLPAAASAQDWEGQVRGYLNANIRNDFSGWTASYDMVINYVGDDREFLIPVTDFSPGTEYLVAAACDDDCGDIDLEVIDPNGRVVNDDTAADDEPWVRWTADTRGQWTIKLLMVDCEADFCYFAVQIMS